MRNMARRVIASTTVDASLITEIQLILRATIHLMAAAGYAAEYTDDDKNTIVVEAHHQDVVEALDSKRWTAVEERTDAGGLYRCGTVTVMDGGDLGQLKIMAVAHTRTLICQG